MSHQGGYAIVDVDEDPAGDIGGQGGQGLEFKTFLSTDPAPNRSTSPNVPRDSPNVPFSPFDIAYYQSYFDVDTNTILKRCGMSMIPREGFVLEVCDGQIDLYGPFWTLTTLILALYMTSTLTSSITSYLSASSEKASSNLPLLSTSTSLVYFYGLLLPTLLWATTKYLRLGGGDSESGAGTWGVVEALGVYGYAMTVFIPISLLCLIPVGILRWVLVGLGAGSSGLFLVRNIYPVLATSDNKVARLLIIAVVVLHAAMALAMKVLFFSYSVGGVNVGPDPIEDPLRF